MFFSIIIIAVVIYVQLQVNMFLTLRFFVFKNCGVFLSGYFVIIWQKNQSTKNTHDQKTYFIEYPVWTETNSLTHNKSYLSQFVEQWLNTASLAKYAPT